jgi:hypothetical protein
MTVIGKLFATGLIAWIVTLALLVAIRVLRGDIYTRGMLVTDPGKTGSIDPERLIAIGLVPAMLVFYTIHTLNTGVVPLPGGGSSMPDLPEVLLSLLAGGNGLYLAGKIARQQ